MSPRGEWTDHEDRRAAEWLQNQGILVSVDIAGQAVHCCARSSVPSGQGHTWKGLGGTKSRDWTSGCRYILGAEDAEYSRARPGAKADCCLILEGPHWIRKSSALRTLAGEYFTDELADLGSKDAAMQTRGVWIIELFELDSLNHSEVAVSRHS